MILVVNLWGLAVRTSLLYDNRESIEEPKEVEKLLILKVRNAGERAECGDLTRGTIRNPVKVIKQLFEVNDIANINWRRIGCLLPMGRSYAMDGTPIMGKLGRHPKHLICNYRRT